jgi:hypothetical protein
MKRTLIVSIIILTFSMTAFVPIFQAPDNGALKPKRTPKPPPTITPAQLIAPTPLSPPNGGTVGVGDVTFTWTAVPGATRYHIQAGLNPYFDQQYNIIENWSLTDTSYTFTVTPGFVTYFPHLYWRVQAIDANNVQGPWSEIWYFTLTNP